MRPKFQKRSALKFDGRIIPEAKPSGIIVGLIPRPLGRKFLLDTPLLAAGLFILCLKENIENKLSKWKTKNK
jgi:hypothetical protein